VQLHVAEFVSVILVGGDAAVSELIGRCLDVGAGRFGLAHVVTIDEAIERLNESSFDLIIAAADELGEVGDRAWTALRAAARGAGIIAVVDGAAGANDGRLAAFDDVVMRQALDPPTLWGAIRYVQERALRAEMQQMLAAMQRELRAAWEIQQRLYPTQSPEAPGYDIAGMSQPAEAIGGDYYDYIPMLDRHLGIAVGDASGHGVGPALLMAQARATLRTLAQTYRGPGEILTLANRILAASMLTRHFVTLMFARLDLAGRTLAYASAGHAGGFVLDADGAIVHDLESTGFPIGVVADSDFVTSAPIHLEPGHMIVLLTDGITEAARQRGHEQFGRARVIDLARAHAAEPARQVVDLLYEKVLEHCHPGTHGDDATIVVIKVLA